MRPHDPGGNDDDTPGCQCGPTQNGGAEIEEAHGMNHGSVLGLMNCLKSSLFELLCGNAVRVCGSAADCTVGAAGGGTAAAGAVAGVLESTAC